MLGTKRRTFGNIVGHVDGVADMSSLSSWTASQFDPSLNWGDVERIKKLWGGKLILKGVMDAEDARLAADSGADALIVSNHGGRQLDGAPSSIEALPGIAEAAGKDIEVWMDGGIRSGQDVLKARALGAQGTMIDRPGHRHHQHPPTHRAVRRVPALRFLGLWRLRLAQGQGPAHQRHQHFDRRARGAWPAQVMRCSIFTAFVNLC